MLDKTTYTPAQILDAAQRAESEGRIEYAIQFLKHVATGFPGSPEAEAAIESLGRLGTAAVRQRSLRTEPVQPPRFMMSLPPARPRHGFVVGRTMAALMIWLAPMVVAARIVAILEPVLPPQPVPVLHWIGRLPLAETLLYGGAAMLLGHTLRALFALALAVEDMNILARARLAQPKPPRQR